MENDLPSTCSDFPVLHFFNMLFVTIYDYEFGQMHLEMHQVQIAIDSIYSKYSKHLMLFDLFEDTICTSVYYYTQKNMQ